MQCTRQQLDKPLFALAVLIGGFFSALRGTATISPSDNLSAAVSNMGPGDILILRGGSYPKLDSNSTKFPSGTSWSDAPKIVAAPGENVTIASLNLAAPSGVGQQSIRYVIFDGINFVPPSGVDGLSIWGAVNHIRFTNFTVHGARNGKMGVNIQPGPGSGGFNEFIGGRVYDNVGFYGGAASSGTTAHGMYIGSYNNLVDRVEIFGNGQHGLQCYSEKTTPSGNIIRNCTVHNNGVTYSSYWVGIVVGGGAGNQVINSQVYNELGGIKVCCRDPSSTIIQNNKLYSNRSFDIEVQSGTGAVVKNNCATKINNGGSNTLLENNSADACGGGGAVVITPTEQQPPIYTAPPSSTPTSTSPPTSAPPSEEGGGSFGGLGTAALIFAIGFAFVVLTD